MLSGQYFRNPKDGSVDLTVISENAYKIIRLLRDLCDSDDLALQLRYLEDLDEETRSLFQETVFAVEILVAYAHVCYFSEMLNCAPNHLTELQAGAMILLDYLDR